MTTTESNERHNFLGLFDFYDQEVFGKAELIQFYGVYWAQPISGVGRGDFFASALLNFKNKTIQLFDTLEAKRAIKIVDFEVTAQSYINLSLED